jgi:hypothetical protein
MKMDISRKERQIGDPIQKINFCLNLLEKEGFNKGINWETQITKRLTMEEIVGALVHISQNFGEGTCL